MVPVMLCLVLAVAMYPAAGQQFRPSYHPRPGGFSHVLPQYASNQPGGSDADVGNRDNAPAAPGNSLEDTQLTDRVQNWPRPNQPFWYLNQQHIAQHTAQSVPCEGTNCPRSAPHPRAPSRVAAESKGYPSLSYWTTGGSGDVGLSHWI